MSHTPHSRLSPDSEESEEDSVRDGECQSVAESALLEPPVRVNESRCHCQATVTKDTLYGPNVGQCFPGAEARQAQRTSL